MFSGCHPGFLQSVRVSVDFCFSLCPCTDISSLQLKSLGDGGRICKCHFCFVKRLALDPEHVWNLIDIIEITANSLSLSFLIYVMA